MNEFTSADLIQGQPVVNPKETPVSMGRTSMPVPMEKMLPSNPIDIDSYFVNYSDYGIARLTIPIIQDMLRAANSGDCTSQCNLFKAILDRDLIIPAHLETRTLSVQSKPWSIQGGDNEQKRQEVKTILESAGINRLTRHLMQAIAFGYAGAAIDWKRKGKFGINCFVLIDQNNWQFTREGGALVKDRFGMQRALTEENGSDFIFFQHELKTGIPPVTGLLRNLVWFWFFKNTAIRQQARYLEQFGIPFLIAKISESDFDNADLKNQILAMLSNLGANGVGVVTNNSEVQPVAVSASQTQNGDFMRWFHYLDEMMTLMILGQLASSDTASGLSKGQMQENVRYDILQADCNTLQQAITNQIVRPLERFKWGTATLSYIIESKEPEDATKVTNLCIGLQKIGYKPKQEWLETILKVPLEPLNGPANASPQAPGALNALLGAGSNSEISQQQLPAAPAPLQLPVGQEEQNIPTGGTIPMTSLSKRKKYKAFADLNRDTQSEVDSLIISSDIPAEVKDAISNLPLYEVAPILIDYSNQYRDINPNAADSMESLAQTVSSTISEIGEENAPLLEQQGFEKTEIPGVEKTTPNIQVNEEPINNAQYVSDVLNNQLRIGTEVPSSKVGSMKNADIERYSNQYFERAWASIPENIRIQYENEKDAIKKNFRDTWFNTVNSRNDFTVKQEVQKDADSWIGKLLQDTMDAGTVAWNSYQGVGTDLISAIGAITGNEGTDRMIQLAKQYDSQIGNPQARTALGYALHAAANIAPSILVGTAINAATFGLGGTAMWALQGFGSAYADARAAGVSRENAIIPAMIGGVVYAFIESKSGGKLTGQVRDIFKREVSSTFAKMSNKYGAQTITTAMKILSNPYFKGVNNVAVQTAQEVMQDVVMAYSDTAARVLNDISENTTLMKDAVGFEDPATLRQLSAQLSETAKQTAAGTLVADVVGALGGRGYGIGKGLLKNKKTPEVQGPLRPVKTEITIPEVPSIEIPAKTEAEVKPSVETPVTETSVTEMQNASEIIQSNDNEAKINLAQDAETSMEDLDRLSNDSDPAIRTTANANIMTRLAESAPQESIVTPTAKKQIINEALYGTELLKDKALVSTIDGAITNKNDINSFVQSVSKSFGSASQQISDSLNAYIQKHVGFADAISNGLIKFNFGRIFKGTEQEPQRLSKEISAGISFDPISGTWIFSIDPSYIKNENDLIGMLAHEDFGHRVLNQELSGNQIIELKAILNDLAATPNNGFWSPETEAFYRKHYTDMYNSANLKIDVNKAVDREVILEKLAMFLGNPKFMSLKPTSSLGRIFDSVVLWFKRTFPFMASYSDKDVYRVINGIYSNYIKGGADNKVLNKNSGILQVLRPSAMTPRVQEISPENRDLLQTLMKEQADNLDDVRDILVIKMNQLRETSSGEKATYVAKEEIPQPNQDINSFLDSYEGMVIEAQNQTDAKDKAQKLSNLMTEGISVSTALDKLIKGIKTKKDITIGIPANTARRVVNFIKSLDDLRIGIDRKYSRTLTNIERKIQAQTEMRTIHTPEKVPAKIKTVGEGGTIYEFETNLPAVEGERSIVITPASGTGSAGMIDIPIGLLRSVRDSISTLERENPIVHDNQLDTLYKMERFTGTEIKPDEILTREIVSLCDDIFRREFYVNQNIDSNTPTSELNEYRDYLDNQYASVGEALKHYDELLSVYNENVTVSQRLPITDIVSEIRSKYIPAIAAQRAKVNYYSLMARYESDIDEMQHRISTTPLTEQDMNVLNRTLRSTRKKIMESDFKNLPIDIVANLDNDTVRRRLFELRSLDLSQARLSKLKSLEAGVKSNSINTLREFSELDDINPNTFTVSAFSGNELNKVRLAYDEASQVTEQQVSQAALALLARGNQDLSTGLSDWNWNINRSSVRSSSIRENLDDVSQLIYGTVIKGRRGGKTIPETGLKQFCNRIYDLIVREMATFDRESPEFSLMTNLSQSKKALEILEKIATNSQAQFSRSGSSDRIYNESAYAGDLCNLYKGYLDFKDELMGISKAMLRNVLSQYRSGKYLYDENTLKNIIAGSDKRFTNFTLKNFAKDQQIPSESRIKTEDELRSDLYSLVTERRKLDPSNIIDQKKYLTMSYDLMNRMITTLDPSGKGQLAQSFAKYKVQDIGMVENPIVIQNAYESYRLLESAVLASLKIPASMIDMIQATKLDYYGDALLSADSLDAQKQKLDLDNEEVAKSSKVEIDNQGQPVIVSEETGAEEVQAEKKYLTELAYKELEEKGGTDIWDDIASHNMDISSLEQHVMEKLRDERESYDDNIDPEPEMTNEARRTVDELNLDPAEKEQIYITIMNGVADFLENYNISSDEKSLVRGMRINKQLTSVPPSLRGKLALSGFYLNEMAEAQKKGLDSQKNADTYIKNMLGAVKMYESIIMQYSSLARGGSVDLETDKKILTSADNIIKDVISLYNTEKMIPDGNPMMYLAMLNSKFSDLQDYAGKILVSADPKLRAESPTSESDIAVQNLKAQMNQNPILMLDRSPASAMEQMRSQVLALYNKAKTALKIAGIDSKGIGSNFDFVKLYKNWNNAIRTMRSSKERSLENQNYTLTPESQEAEQNKVITYGRELMDAYEKQAKLYADAIKNPQSGYEALKNKQELLPRQSQDWFKQVTAEAPEAKQEQAIREASQEIPVQNIDQTTGRPISETPLGAQVTEEDVIKDQLASLDNQIRKLDRQILEAKADPVKNRLIAIRDRLIATKAELEAERTGEKKTQYQFSDHILATLW